MMGSHFEPLEAQRRPARSSTVILMSDMGALAYVLL
jgi:hypothetical protein